MMTEFVPEAGRDSWRPGGGSGPHFVMGQPEGRGFATGTSAQDAALKARLATDLDGSFEDLVRAYQDRLYSYALRLIGKPEDAEEAAQDAFVRAYRALATYPASRIEELVLRPWLYRITLNVVRNRFRGKKLRTLSLDHPLSADSETLWEPADDPSERPDARYEGRRRKADIATLVASLPERYRAPLVLRYVEGLKLEEVSRVLSQPLGTTKSNVHRGVNALREALSASRREGVKR